jgi:hypothetical protein
MEPKRFLTALLLTASIARAVIVDRVAVIVGNRIVKDSDITDDLKSTAFLNQESLAVTSAARKKAANLLVDQMLIRKELESGDYPSGSVTEAHTLLADLKHRYADETSYKRALASRRIDEADLNSRLLWQLTVLRFIDARFRPAALATTEEVEKYYNEHKSQLQAANPANPATLDRLRPQIEDLLSGERVNQLLEDWLKRKRQETRIVYLEDDLK